MAYSWSAKQREVESALDSKEWSTILIPGPVQSGKSLAAMFFFLAWAARNWSGYEFALCARSMKQFRAVEERYAREFGLLTGLGWTQKSEFFEQSSAYGVLPNRFFVGLGTDRTSEGKFRGPTFAGALLDEVTLMPGDFVDTVMDRCSVEGAKVVMTCNPAGPMHPIKTTYIDPAPARVCHIPFALADNPTLTQDYIDGLHARYKGAALRRMVYGEWSAASGMIYPQWQKAIGRAPDISEAWRFRMSYDYADSSVTHAILWALYPGGERWAVKEWRYDGRTDGQVEPYQQARRIKRHFAGRSLSEITGDPRALEFRKALHTVFEMPVLEGNSDVLPGIQKVQDDIETGMLKIDEAGCPHLVEEGYNYIWDENAASMGIDKPIKENDHGMDAMRYDTWTHAAPRRRRKVRMIGGPYRRR